MLDLRTQEGRYARDICDGIAADLGGVPNAAQQVLCQMFALKVLRVQLLVKTILSGETVNRHTENYALAWMNSARRDLEALNVLTAPSSVRSLFDVPPSEMTDEQLDEALRLLGHPMQQPLIDQCGDETSGQPEDADL
jgi:hypothetical protein